MSFANILTFIILISYTSDSSSYSKPSTVTILQAYLLLVPSLSQTKGMLFFFKFFIMHIQKIEQFDLLQDAQTTLKSSEFC